MLDDVFKTLCFITFALTRSEQKKKRRKKGVWLIIQSPVLETGRMLLEENRVGVCGALFSLLLLLPVALLNFQTQTWPWTFARCTLTCCPALAVVARQLRLSHPRAWPRLRSGLDPLSRWRLSFDSRGDPLTPEQPAGGLNYLPGRYLIICLLPGLFVFTERPRVSPLSPFCPPVLQACAHRWKNVYYDSEHILPHGYCSIIPPTLQGRTKPLIPCYEGTVKAPRWTPELFVDLPQLPNMRFCGNKGSFRHHEFDDLLDSIGLLF